MRVEEKRMEAVVEEKVEYYVEVRSLRLKHPAERCELQPDGDYVPV